MADIRAQVILHTVDAVPENFVSNSFAFTVATPSTSGTLLTPLIKAFYDSIKGYLSPTLATSGHEIKYSLLPGTPPNYPFDVDTWSFATGLSGTALPDEIAVCLSFQGAKGAGFPQARRRGRIYMGPLNQNAALANRPVAAFLTTAAVAADTLGTAVNALGAGYSWTVWSQADGASVPVIDGWLDNAFDTQRRRGVLPTSRTVWTV